MISKSWWSAAGMRALKTFAQALLATIPTTLVINATVNWMGVGLALANIFGSAALAAVLSLLTSLAGLPEVSAKNEPIK